MPRQRELVPGIEFAREIFDITNTAVNLKVAGANEFPAKVPRPKYSVLENRALKTSRLEHVWHMAGRSPRIPGSFPVARGGAQSQ